MPLWGRNGGRTLGKQLKQTNRSATTGRSGRQDDTVLAVAHGADFDYPAPGQAGDITPPFGQGALADFGNCHCVKIFHALRIP
jgi:hypothetical protein